MPTLYLDMDGVVADFNGFAQQYLGSRDNLSPEAERWPEEQWQRLREVPNLYRHLAKTEIADELVDLARLFRDQLGWQLYMLTATPKGNDVPDSFWDKCVWQLARWPDITIRFGPYSRDKKLHCRPGDILVDDRRDNCDDWEAQGGQVVRVNRSQLDQALKDLQRIYSQLSVKDTDS